MATMQHAKNKENNVHQHKEAFSMFRFFNNIKVVPWVLISIPALLIFGFYLYPLFSSFYVSLFNYKILDKVHTFVGFNNYINIFKYPDFLQSMQNTFTFTIVYVALVLVIGLLMALIVNTIPKSFQNLIKTVYFLPVVVSIVPISIIFNFLLYSTGAGPINSYLSYLGIQPVQWLTSTDWSMKSVIFVTLWKNAGFVMVLYLAGLLSIPTSYYEAACIDGANSYQAFWHITLPLLKNTTIFLLVSSIIGAFQVFTQVLVMTAGGPTNSTATLAFTIYEVMFRQQQMGSAAAMGFIMFFILLAATFMQLRYYVGKDSRQEVL